MSATILVTYASRYGSTAEVAAAVTTSLRESGLDVDIQPMRNVQSLDGYSLVVLGAPLYIGHWHKDTKGFLSRHQQSLMQRQVAIFTLGPIESDEEEWEDVRIQLEQELASYPWLKPVAFELFGGKYDPAELRFPGSLLAKLPVSPLYQMPASDARDWIAIRAWITKLVTLTQPNLTS
jgi:menaquinone-dependent protoporphyrinogen oxidase